MNREQFITFMIHALKDVPEHVTADIFADPAASTS